MVQSVEEIIADNTSQGRGKSMLTRRSMIGASWRNEQYTSGKPDITLPVYKEMALEITSTAENSTKDWTTAYKYIEDISDGRGYTGGLIGFCSGTGDMRVLMLYYQQIAPSNILNKYLGKMDQIMAAPYKQRPAKSHSLLDPDFVPDWKSAANNDPLFRQAQRDERERVYWLPALQAAVDDGLSPLGLEIYYDVLVNHGPGDDPESFGGIRNGVKANYAAPSAGGDEITFLNKIVDAREAVLIEWGDNQSDGRVSMHRQLLGTGNLDLTTPFSWNIYGDSFTISTPPATPAS